MQGFLDIHTKLYYCTPSRFTAIDCVRPFTGKKEANTIVCVCVCVSAEKDVCHMLREEETKHKSTPPLLGILTHSFEYGWLVEGRRGQ